jgi:aminoglycoside 3-N-acetyltransferase
VETIGYERLVSDLKKLGVSKGDLLNVKMSLKSIGQVEGGAETVLNAILDVVGKEGTVITDSFVEVHRLPLRRKDRVVVDDNTPSYAGALANAVLKHPDMVRSRHPIQKFAGIGKLAKELMLSHTPDSYAYDVLRKMSHMGGKNLKIGKDEVVVGVGTTHVAIGELGFKRNRPSLGVLYRDEKNNIKLFKINWPGICSDGLIKFIPYYRKGNAILSEGFVGNADSKITYMEKTLQIELDLLKNDPRFFFCDNPLCDGCRLTWEFSEKKYGLFLYEAIRRKNIKKIVKVFLGEPAYRLINKILG